jgi:peptidoglycan/LPS O-acetylase OafA/YrhL
MSAADPSPPARPASPPDPTIAAAEARPKGHLTVLDGWRGISIALVLAAHLLPLGPKPWELNEATARMGMAIFFTLSGFLITRLLLADTRITDFLIRRVLRIVPLAWLAMAIAFPLTDAAANTYLPNFLFYANLPPIRLTAVASHLWSLCVEMQFYLAIAMVVLLAGARGLVFMPLLGLAVTLLRVRDGAYLDIVTWHRIDEILAGVTLALISGERLGQAAVRLVSRCNVYWLVPLAAVTCHPDATFMNYLRPYAVALMVGSTLYAPPAAARALLSSRVLKYLAAISFALYVIHGVLMETWLGSGDRLVKYAKRPLLFALTFALAHVSTFHYEARWIALGKRLTARRRGDGP